MEERINENYEAKEMKDMVGRLEKADAINFVEQMQEKRKEPREKNVPISEKVLLTIDEAAKYTGIGQGKLREISNEDNCPFVLWNGSKRMFKREKLVSFLYSTFSI